MKGTNQKDGYLHVEVGPGGGSPPPGVIPQREENIRFPPGEFSPKPDSREDSWPSRRKWQDS